MDHRGMREVVIYIGDRLDIYTANELQAMLSRALEAEGPIAADLGAADRIHTAALQLLVAAAVCCSKSKRPFTLTGVSAPVASALKLAGLYTLLGTDQAGDPDAAGATG